MRIKGEYDLPRGNGVRRKDPYPASPGTASAEEGPVSGESGEDAGDDLVLVIRRGDLFQFGVVGEIADFDQDGGASRVSGHVDRLMAGAAVGAAGRREHAFLDLVGQTRIVCVELVGGLLVGFDL